MGFELDSEMRSRLVRHYQQVSDKELVEAAACPDDLTPVAQEVVRTELESRGLERAWSGEPEDEVSFGAMQATSLPKPEFGSAIEKGRVALITFRDAIEAERACATLDEGEIALELKNLAETEGRGSSWGGQPIALQLIVDERDRGRAVKLLREEMGLFPLEEIAEPDVMVDDGTVATVGQFARSADAEEVARVLTEAKVWNRITANEDGSVETEDAYLVEVREVDLMGAGELVEKALGLPEG